MRPKSLINLMMPPLIFIGVLTGRISINLAVILVPIPIMFVIYTEVFEDAY
jgi:hypothetical protein